ncbi:hypothetical protein SCOCK_190065 [Actinacidiphila cocklensis]|uniref:Uncharacterized protein n=1 Tax=Actinacidiphila cocklensis TaxID=887465 RepID=A0A9W4E4W0_9ACTN|nr:hypothetical protein SCOCK_190065 [Actinacidiphila cocklensis]
MGPGPRIRCGPAARPGRPPPAPAAGVRPPARGAAGARTPTATARAGVRAAAAAVRARAAAVAAARSAERARRAGRGRGPAARRADGPAAAGDGLLRRRHGAARRRVGAAAGPALPALPGRQPGGPALVRAVRRGARPGRPGPDGARARTRGAAAVVAAAAAPGAYRRRGVPPAHPHPAQAAPACGVAGGGRGARPRGLAGPGPALRPGLEHPGPVGEAGAAAPEHRDRVHRGTRAPGGHGLRRLREPLLGAGRPGRGRRPVRGGRVPARRAPGDDPDHPGLLGGRRHLPHAGPPVEDHPHLLRHRGPPDHAHGHAARPGGPADLRGPRLGRHQGPPHHRRQLRRDRPPPAGHCGSGVLRAPVTDSVNP